MKLTEQDKKEANIKKINQEEFQESNLVLESVQLEYTKTSSEKQEDETNESQRRLLSTYERYMLLKIFVNDSHDKELRIKYIETAFEHNQSLLKNHEFINAGFDIFTPAPDNTEEINIFGPNVIRCFGTGWEDTSPVNKIDFKIKCSAQIITDTNKQYYTGYYMYPRSSLSKTKLRLANSVGIIDAGYRGNLIGMFDITNIDENIVSEERDYDYLIQKYDRLVQICGPNLLPIFVEIVDTEQELSIDTLRGSNGFGSTGR